MIEFRSDLRRVDWEALKQDLIADGFHNGRTAAQLRLSFENSAAVAMGFAGGRCIATGRMLSDSVGNAYVLDVWTHSAYRKQGLAREIMQRLLAAVPGQHVYLQTDHAAGFYEKLGFVEQPKGMSLTVGEYLQNDSLDYDPDGVETHAFGNFIPPNARYLILGSFSARGAVTEPTSEDNVYDWFYATRRNQFWPILEEIYGISLRNRRSREKLFTQLGIAIADIIHKCIRERNTSADNNLKIIQYNPALPDILDNNPIETILFTSRFVEQRFKRMFKASVSSHPEIELVSLPSPSPRYATMSLQQKTEIYRQLFPGIEPEVI